MMQQKMPSMDRAEAMRCLHGLRLSNSVSIAFGQRRPHLKQKQDKSRTWLIPTGLVRHLECKLMAGPIGHPMVDLPIEHSSTSPIPTAGYCLREMDSLQVTTVSSRLMPRTKSSWHTV